ncbi:MAG: CcoQ/FixQ family Cbb3-type cytochrome c oxidase assembly chaperone [Chitinophagaceae bacterium]|nr:CcoQ/FixQ family Cbb3-type cytochrome c oxidase assembly chaperone [Chitinophagaceae bacterium]
MFKFIKQYAETINGVDIYPMISLFIFFTFFIVLLVLVKKMKKERIEILSNLPLENEE